LENNIKFDPVPVIAEVSRQIGLEISDEKVVAEKRKRSQSSEMLA
jgi:hypothetical protein